MILQPIFCNGFDILMDELLITTEVVFPVGCWCLVDVQLRTEGSVEIIEVKTAPCSSASSPDLPLSSCSPVKVLRLQPGPVRSGSELPLPGRASSVSVQTGNKTRTQII